MYPSSAATTNCMWCTHESGHNQDWTMQRTERHGPVSTWRNIPAIFLHFCRMRAEIRRSYPKRDLSFCTSIRGYSFVGPCLQSWFRGTLQNKLKEREKDHTDGQNMWYDRTHHTPELHTHTHKYKHTYIYSFIVMGGEVVRYGNREESQPRTVGLPYAVVDFGISSPLDAGFWIVFPHIYIRNGSHRAVLSTPSHMIESHPHPHIHILYNYCFFDLFCFIPVLNNPKKKNMKNEK